MVGCGGDQPHHTASRGSQAAAVARRPANVRLLVRAAQNRSLARKGKLFDERCGRLVAVSHHTIAVPEPHDPLQLSPLCVPAVPGAAARHAVDRCQYDFMGDPKDKRRLSDPFAGGERKILIRLGKFSRLGLDTAQNHRTMKLTLHRRSSGIQRRCPQLSLATRPTCGRASTASLRRTPEPSAIIWRPFVSGCFRPPLGRRCGVSPAGRRPL